MFKTNSIKKGNPQPIGELKLKGEKEWCEFFQVVIGKAIKKVSDKEYQSVDSEYYLLADGTYVCSLDCSLVMYHAPSYIPE